MSVRQPKAASDAPLVEPVPTVIVADDTAPLALAPRLLNDKDGVEIPQGIKDYVAVLQTERGVELHVSFERAGSPAAHSLERFFQRRPDIYPSVRVIPAPYDTIRALLHKHSHRETDTVSLERRVVEVLRGAGTYGTSDIHLKQRPGDKAVILFRIDGDLLPSGEQMSRDAARNFCNALYTMADATSKKGSYSDTEPRQAAILTNLERYGLKSWFSAIRLQFKATVLGPEVVIRLQPAQVKARALSDLGLANDQLTLLIRMLHAPHGAVLISGPTGSGKSVTAAAMTDYFTRIHPEKSANTIEDPAEIALQDASQHQVNEQDHTKRPQKFTELLRTMLRSDFDFIMLQECRDADSAIAFLEIAITGRLGLSTIHTPTPSMIIERLRGWGIDRVTLRNPETITGLVGVRLAKTLCSCKLPVADALRRGDERAGELSPSLRRLQGHAAHAYRKRGQPVPDLYRTAYTRNIKGCPRCHNPNARVRHPPGTGGRTQLAEIIATDATLLDHLVDGRFEQADHYLRSVLRVPSLFEDAIERVQRGQICPLDAESVLGHFRVPQSHDEDTPTEAMP